MERVKLLHALASLFALTTPALAQTLVQTLASPIEGFGWDVDMTSGRILVGASYIPLIPVTQRALIYERTGGSWSQVDELIPSDSPAWWGYASTLAIDGDTAVVGAPVGTSGKIYVFEHDGVAWSEVAILEDDGPRFAEEVGISGDWIVTGSSIDRALVFHRGANGWEEAGELTPSVQVAAFGRHVSISGQRAAVSGWTPSPAFETSTVVVFELDGSAWTEVAAVEGMRPALSGDRLIVSRYWYGDDGEAAIFARSSDGTWSEEATLEPPGFANDFGWRVELSGGRAAVGTRGGSPDLFTWELGPGGWTQVSALEADPFPLALCGRWLVSGDPAESSGGEVLVHEYESTFLSVGPGLAGSGGFTPELDGAGCARLGSDLTLALTDGLGAAAGLLAIGFSELALPFFGGTFYVGSFIVTMPHVLDGAVGVPGAGSFSVTLSVPTDPSLVGACFFLQAGYADAGGPLGVSLSNGIRLELE